RGRRRQWLIDVDGDTGADWIAVDVVSERHLLQAEGEGPLPIVFLLGGVHPERSLLRRHDQAGVDRTGERARASQTAARVLAGVMDQQDAAAACPLEAFGGIDQLAHVLRTVLVEPDRAAREGVDYDQAGHAIGCGSVEVQKLCQVDGPLVRELDGTVDHEQARSVDWPPVVDMPRL